MFRLGQNQNDIYFGIDGVYAMNINFQEQLSLQVVPNKIVIQMQEPRRPCFRPLYFPN